MRIVDVGPADYQNINGAQYESLAGSGIQVNPDGEATRWENIRVLSDFTIGQDTFLRGEEVRLQWKIGNVNKNEMPKTFKGMSRADLETVGIDLET